MSDQNQWGAEPPTSPAPQFHPKSPPPSSGEPQDPPPARQRPADPWAKPGEQILQPGYEPTQNWSPAQQTPQAPQAAPQPPGGGAGGGSGDGGQAWSPQPYQQQPYQQQPYQQQPYQQPYDQQQPYNQPYQPPQGPGGWSPTPPQQLPGSGKPPRRRRRKMRRSFMALFTIIVIVVLLVIGDRVALAIAENEFATQAQQSGLPVKPSVDIEGFPFLTQLIAKDFKKVDLTANNIPAGPVTITSVHATIKGLHISGFSASAHATADQVNATAFVSFGNIISATGLGNVAQITAKQDGPNKLQLSVGIAGFSAGTEDIETVQTGAQSIEIKLLGGSGLGSLGSGQSFSFKLPAGVPASLKITSLNLDNQGLTVSLAASNVELQKS